MALTVQQAGWAGKQNGALLALAETEFDAFVTVDANLPYQQQLDQYNLAFVILHATSNKPEEILPLAPLILDALLSIAKGQVVHIPDQNP
jgi:hypothetical protein